MAMDDARQQHILRQAQAAQQAQQVMLAALQQALQSPLVIKRADTSLVALSDEAGSNGSEPRKTLHVAIPNGERWDVPLSPAAERALLRALTGGGSELSE